MIRSADGGELTLAIIQPGGVFGEPRRVAKVLLSRGEPGQAAVLLRAAESLWRGRPLD